MLNIKRLVSSSGKMIFHMQILIRLVVLCSANPIGSRKLSRKQVSDMLIQVKIPLNIFHL